MHRAFASITVVIIQNFSPKALSYSHSGRFGNVRRYPSAVGRKSGRGRDSICAKKVQKATKEKRKDPTERQGVFSFPLPHMRPYANEEQELGPQDFQAQ